MEPEREVSAQTPAPGQTGEKKSDQMKPSGEKSGKNAARKKGGKVHKKSQNGTGGMKKEEEEEKK